jgi:hypothetical protein
LTGCQGLDGTRRVDTGHGCGGSDDAGTNGCDSRGRGRRCRGGSYGGSRSNSGGSRCGRARDDMDSDGFDRTGPNRTSGITRGIRVAYPVFDHPKIDSVGADGGEAHSPHDSAGFT